MTKFSVNKNEKNRYSEAKRDNWDVIVFGHWKWTEFGCAPKVQNPKSAK